MEDGSSPRRRAAALAVAVVALAVAACGAPDQLSQEQGDALMAARERLDDAIDTEETLRTSPSEARLLVRGVRSILSRGALEAERLDEFGRAALGELRLRVPSLVDVDSRGDVRALDRAATEAFLRYARVDAQRALLGPAEDEVKAIERTIEDSGADGETRVPPSDPTASLDLPVSDFLREAERDLKPIWPELAKRLRKVGDGL